MKLFVIVLCLLSERFLIHSLSFKRLDGMKVYMGWFEGLIKSQPVLNQTYITLLLFILLPVIPLALIIFYFGGWLAGLVGLVIQLAVVYYCLGPENVFYPQRTGTDSPSKYFEALNGQVIAVIFWYYLAGPIGAVIYRLISFVASGYSAEKSVVDAAKQIQSLLDWIPARITAILYLLVGNFQSGRLIVKANFFSGLGSNGVLLKQAGLSAAAVKDDETGITAVEKMIEHSIVIYLFIIALLTLIAWFNF